METNLAILKEWKSVHNVDGADADQSKSLPSLLKPSMKS